MNGLNDVTIMGTLGADAEVRHLENDKSVANMSIAINESYLPKNGGDRIETTEWVKVEAWNGIAKFLGNYGKKGTCFIIKGKLKTDSYVKDVNGQQITLYSTKVVADKILFAGNKINTTTAPVASQTAQPTAQPTAPVTTQPTAPVTTQPTAPVTTQPIAPVTTQAQAQTQQYVSQNEFTSAKENDDLPF